MRFPLNFLIVGLLIRGVAQGSAIESAWLNDEKFYPLAVATNRVTTVCFPGAIAAIDGAEVSVDTKSPASFLLAHTRGSSFLSVRALTPNGSGNLNVRFGKRTYVFELTESARPTLALNLRPQPKPVEVDANQDVTPSRLIGLLDKAKSFVLLKTQHPDSVADVEFQSFVDCQKSFDYGDFEIFLEELFIMPGSWVFRVRLHNKTASSITYKPGSFALLVNGEQFPQLISDASGVLPGSSDAIVYFAVSGPTGLSHALLSQHAFDRNSVSIVLERYPTP